VSLQGKSKRVIVEPIAQPAPPPKVPAPAAERPAEPPERDGEPQPAARP
jgi:hypothetical protein